MQVLEAGSDLVDTLRCEAVSSITSLRSKMGKQKKKLLKFSKVSLEIEKTNISHQFLEKYFKICFGEVIIFKT